MKSVRTAPVILPHSSVTMLIAGLATSALCLAATALVLCRYLWAVFSNPFKHRYVPLTISSGVTAQGVNALMVSISLLCNELLYTAHTISSSWSTSMPLICCLFSARLSFGISIGFLAATLVSRVHSSRMVAMSSMRASRHRGYGGAFQAGSLSCGGMERLSPGLKLHAE
jgi:hypothetical protein